MAKTVSRLYNQFQPKHYDLHLTPNSSKSSFTGSVTITGKKTHRPNQRMTLHQNGLTVTEATLIRHDKKGDQHFTIDRINSHGSYDELRLHTKEKQFPGEYSITLKFQGKITTPMQGIYPCFFDHDGQKKQLLATQFESHHAREVFPCVDEPEAKATFQLSLTVPKNETTLSNTPIQTTTTKNDLQTVTFEPTPKMSSYLLAFVVGEMHCEEKTTKDGVLVRSWASVAQDKALLTYSLDEAVDILEFFTDYFGVAYPLAKCDQVALPDFDAGAMENWGLITYREVALLVDLKNRSISSEQFVSMVVAHEVSHQWFGNLVTMKWWDDLWLNESFASLMEHLALDALHPNWHQWELYTASDVINTSSRDIYKDIQSVSVQVTDPDLIETLFDPGIVYAKGGRLLKMLREYIGDKAFRSGLQAYFNKHAYGNTNREDLWEALSDSSGQDISALMTPWLTQPGMPVLQVTHKDKTITLSQKRFVLDSSAPDDSLWPIPLLAQPTLQPDLMKSQSGTIIAASSEPVVINSTASGHYITHYTQKKHTDFLANQLAQRKLPTEARINILNDMVLLARRGDASLVDALQVAARCKDEDRDSVWALIARVVGSAFQLTEGDNQSDKNLKALKIQLASSWFSSLGWDDSSDDDPNTKQLRHTILALMLSSDDSAALVQATKRYENTKKIEDLPAEIRSLILGSVVKQDYPGAVAKLLSSYPQASAELQQDIALALASTKQPKVAQNIIGQALGDSGFVRDQDILRWIAYFLRNHHVRSISWNFMVENWDWIESALGKSKSFDYLPTYCAGIITTPQWQTKYHDLFKSKEHIKMLKHNIKLGYADIEARVAWRQRDEAAIKLWLNTNL